MRRAVTAGFMLVLTISSAGQGVQDQQAVVQLQIGAEVFLHGVACQDGLIYTSGVKRSSSAQDQISVYNPVLAKLTLGSDGDVIIEWQKSLPVHVASFDSRVLLKTGLDNHAYAFVEVSADSSVLFCYDSLGNLIWTKKINGTLVAFQPGLRGALGVITWSGGTGTFQFNMVDSAKNLLSFSMFESTTHNCDLELLPQANSIFCFTGYGRKRFVDGRFPFWDTAVVSMLSFIEPYQQPPSISFDTLNYRNVGLILHDIAGNVFTTSELIDGDIRRARIFINKENGPLRVHVADHLGGLYDMSLVRVPNIGYAFAYNLGGELKLDLFDENLNRLWSKNLDPSLEYNRHSITVSDNRIVLAASGLDRSEWGPPEIVNKLFWINVEP